MLLMVFITSCSNSKTNKLLEQVPQDIDFLVVGDVTTILESAGGSLEDSKIKLPSYILDQFSSYENKKIDEFTSFVKDSGIDPEACAIIGNYEYNYPIIIFSIEDRKKFSTAIEDLGFREKSDDDGITLYTKKEDYEYSDVYSYIAIKGSYAYYIDKVWEEYSEIKPTRVIERLIADASDSPYSKTSFADFITSGNACGASFRIPREVRKELRRAGVSSSFVDLCEGVICMNGNLGSDNATLDIKWFNEDGKEKDIKDLENLFDSSATIDPEALAYLGENESYITAVSLKGFNWNKCLDIVADQMSRSERTILDIVKNYLENIDGTVAFGFGFTNGIESVFNLGLGNDIWSQFDCTLVVDTKDGKTTKLMTDLKDILETTGMTVNGNSSAFNFEVGQKTTIYALAEDNHIILSNHKIHKVNDNPAVKSLDFKGYIYAAAFCMNRDNKLLRDLNINYNINLTFVTDAKDCESTIKLKIEGESSEGILEKAAKLILDLFAQNRSLYTKYEERRRELYGDYEYPIYDYYTDSTVCVVEEIPYEMADSVVW